MSLLLVETPHVYFSDATGAPLEAGYVYIGVPNLDPESSPVTVYWNKGLTVRALQPIRTISGRPSYNGTPGNLYVNATDYSITVKDKNMTLVATLPSAKDTELVSSAATSSASESIPTSRVVSGATRTLSEQPNFLSLDGGTPSVTVLGETTPLKVVIDGSDTTVSTDVTKTQLITASSVNNTCLVNDATLSDQLASKYTGEDNTTLTIDSAGSEISTRVGQVAAFQKNGGSEIMLAYIKSATELVDVKRGWFYDSDDDPIVRETLANNDQLNILSLAWLFVENDGVTIEVTYRTPSYSFTAPTTPSVGDYWFDMAVGSWKKYSAVWSVANQVLIGTVCLNTTIAVGKREVDFFHDYRATNTGDTISVISDEVVRVNDFEQTVFVYSKVLRIYPDHLQWDATTDMETGSIAADTTYYLYLAATGESVISTEKYHVRNSLMGEYHPYEAWRCLGTAKTDSSADWRSASGLLELSILKYAIRGSEAFSESGTFRVPAEITEISVCCIGGGGGGDNGALIGETFEGKAGGGGALVWGTVSVTPGSTWTVTVGAGGSAGGGNGGASSFSDGVTTLTANGGNGGDSNSQGGSYSGGDGGGNGGNGGTTTQPAGSFNGGGGAGGYTGNGGNGRSGASTGATNGAGGGGSGSDGHEVGVQRGGGVGPIIVGASGLVSPGLGGNPGSTDFTSVVFGQGGDGGIYGSYNGTGGVGGHVRVTWGFNANGPVAYPDNSAT